LRNGAARRVAHRRGADGDDARTESGTKEGLWWWKTEEVDTWAMGDECAALGHGRMRRTTRAGENFRPTGGSSVLRGGGPEGWAPRGGGAGEIEGQRGA
jgi:hypothetical protein